MTQELLFFKNLKNKQKKNKKNKLESLLTAREESENLKPYYSFVALSSNNLNGWMEWTDGRTDGRKLQNMYMISPFVKNKILFTHKTRISMKHETCFLEMISAGKHCNLTQTMLEALICTGRIAESRA